MHKKVKVLYERLSSNLFIFMRILGIDPGTATTGFGIIEVTGGRFRPLNFGHIQTEKTYSQAERLDQIAYDLALLCQQWRPTACAVEKL